MENELKELAELVEKMGSEKIITLKIEINPFEVRACIKINESMIGYIKSISTLEKEEILKVFEPVISEVEKSVKTLKDKIINNQKEFKKEDMLNAIEKVLNKLKEEQADGQN